MCVCVCVCVYICVYVCVLGDYYKFSTMKSVDDRRFFDISHLMIELLIDRLIDILEEINGVTRDKTHLARRILFNTI